VLADRAAHCLADEGVGNLQLLGAACAGKDYHGDLKAAPANASLPVPVANDEYSDYATDEGRRKGIVPREPEEQGFFCRRQYPSL
jgi:hypothetical protein